jgi:hypothetical protein
MDHKIMARALERVEQHVVNGGRLIAQQKALIASLSAARLDASAFRNTLARLEQAQSIRVQSAAELRRALRNAAPTESFGRRSGPDGFASASLRLTSL